MGLCLKFVGWAFLAFLVTGCFAVDELDKGAEEMARYSGHPNEPDPSASESHQATRDSGPFEFEAPDWRRFAPDVDKWWRSASSLLPGQSGGRIIQCIIGNHEKIIEEKECRARGGTPR